MDGGRPKSSQRVLASVRGLAPVVAEHRVRFDRERRLPREVVSAMAAADLFRLWVPRSFGGAELSARELFEHWAVFVMPNDVEESRFRTGRVDARS